MIFLFLLPLALAITDPCSLIQAGVPILASTANACLHNIPFNATRRDQTVESLINGIQLYTFLDIATNPPTTLNAPVDILGSLLSIKATTFSSDYAMHEAFAGLFRQLNDAHTRYRPRACYLKFNFYVAAPLYSYNAAGTVGTQKPEMSFLNPREAAADLMARDIHFEAVVAAAEKIYGASFARDIGEATVLSINGLKNMDGVVRFANNSVGISKSLETRVGISLTRFFANGISLGQFTKRTPNWNPLPPSELTFVVRTILGQTKTFKLPFYMFSPVSFTGTDDLEDWCYGDLTTTTVAQVDVVELDNKVLDNPERWQSTRKRQVEEEGEGEQVEERKRAVPPGFRLVVNENQVMFWVGTNSGGEKVLVMFLPTFSIPEADQAFASSVARGYSIGAAYGATNFIIDLSGNGGGNICVGKALAAFTGLVTNPVVSDMPGSTLANALARVYANTTVSPWSSLAYASDATGEPYETVAWLIPGVTKTRGGLQRQYSQFLELSDASCGDALFKVHLPTQFKPSKVHIVTKGECGSTCAYFADELHLYAHVNVTLIGAHRPSTGNYVSFPGFQVLESSEIYETIEQANLTGNAVPETLTKSGTWRACVRQIYGPTNKNVPLEYRYLKPDQALLLNRFEAKTFGSYWNYL